MADVIYKNWHISQGKGNRHYINYRGINSNGVGLMHPEEISESNGLGLYGYELLEDLAVAILKFEEENQSGIISKLKETVEDKI